MGGARYERTPVIDTIVDINHNDDVKSWSQAANARVVACIHKASEGTTWTDPSYASRRLLATREGLLWGAYHFANGSDGTKQADHFLQAAAPSKDTLIALDLEHNPNGKTVTLGQACDFVKRIIAKLGRAPWAYGSDRLAEFAEQDPHSILAVCPLWIARYGVHPPVVPKLWTHWTLWQYLAGESAGAHDALPGLGKVDRSRFAGDLVALKAVWAA